MGWLRQFIQSHHYLSSPSWLMYITISSFDCFPSLDDIYKHFVARLARLMLSQLLTPLHLLQMRLTELFFTTGLVYLRLMSIGYNFRPDF